MTHVKRIRGNPNDKEKVDIIVTMKEEWEKIKETEIKKIKEFIKKEIKNWKQKFMKKFEN